MGYMELVVDRSDSDKSRSLTPGSVAESSADGDRAPEDIDESLILPGTASTPVSDPRGDLKDLEQLAGLGDESAQSSTSPGNIPVPPAAPHSVLLPLFFGVALTLAIVVTSGIVLFVFFAPPSGGSPLDRALAVLRGPPPNGAISQPSRTLDPAPIAPSDEHWLKPDRSQGISSVPAPLAIEPQQVLADAEAMKGERFGRGFVEVGQLRTELVDAAVLFNHARTAFNVVFFSSPVTPEHASALASPNAGSLETLFAGDNPAALVLAAELSPFGSDCAPLSIRRYRWIAAAPAAKGTSGKTLIDLVRNPNTNDISEFKHIDCTRKAGAILTLQAEGSARASASSATETRASGDVRSASWSVSLRKEIVISHAELPAT